MSTALALACGWRAWQMTQIPASIEQALEQFDRQVRERRDRLDARGETVVDASLPERRLYDVRDLLRPAIQFNRDIRGVRYSPEGGLARPMGGSMGGSGISDPYTDWGQAARELQNALWWYRGVLLQEDSLRPDGHDSGVLVVEALPADHEHFAEMLEMLHAVIRDGADR